MTFSYVVIVLAIVAVAISLSCVALLVQYRRLVLEIKCESNRQLRMANSSLVGMGNRLLDMEKRLQVLRSDQQVLSDTQQDFSYAKAKTLIEKGIQLEAVAASTGLSYSELELIQLIKKQNTSDSESYSSEY